MLKPRYTWAESTLTISAPEDDGIQSLATAEATSTTSTIRKYCMNATRRTSAP